MRQGIFLLHQLDTVLKYGQNMKEIITKPGLTKIKKRSLQVCVDKKWGTRGSPWEFNLRDTRRWCDLISSYPHVQPSFFIHTLYTSKFRSPSDRDKVGFAFCASLSTSSPS